MKVDGEWLTAAPTQAVLGMLESGGHVAYAVGGCVRNALMGVAVADVDIATDASPQRVVALAQAAGLKPVPTGIDHGTVTVVVDGIGHEVTTFRTDVETNGRHAVVRFSSCMAEDAQRRDFTMNALYADARGQVFDPVGGLPDLQARRVRFIGDASARIAEDYLRILRFFRFCAWYADPAQGMDPVALAGIADGLDGLESLSAERVGQELLKLLAAPDPAPAVATMAQLGVLARVLPGAMPDALAPLVHLEAGLTPDSLRRLAVLGSNGEGLRLSKHQKKRLMLYREASGSLAEIAWRHGETIARDIALIRAASLGQTLDPETEVAIAKGAAAVFPVKPRDLMPGLQGAALGAALKDMETRWIASGFALTKDELIR
ncbi:CCA tRNA nucleotidyltransferase [Salipiger sp. 1_MG-2023]|uniref:CCA tRNA nucleotidyltransferase n=1 Tax=Salipiger sp. 1_MG-2023 TaxID=3062665 RepID=UPI0026E33C1F|nr:CCA tRNA nucleotidyltransferase [Salipiger sp. 1_MG-2023]MDO6586717.1 CCA tRNA nucleotidyltransferase [Salipiger sp. 1_MG-2023]